MTKYVHTLVFYLLLVRDIASRSYYKFLLLLCKVNFRNGTYLLYKKINGKLLHEHTFSNHLPQIMKQVLFFISERLCNSSNEAVFEYIKLEHREIFRKSGYQFTLKFESKYTPGKVSPFTNAVLWELY